MENASKALIMSGAVLIAIIIISIGIYIISANQGTIKTTEELGKTLEVRTYNSTFEKYAGPNKFGSEVRELLKDIKTNNVRDSAKTITVNSKTSIEDINKIYNAIKPNQKYSVSTTPDSKGYVNTVSILDSSGVVVTGT